MKSWGTLGFISMILVLIGGINWGLVGLAEINIISGIFGYILSRLIYIAVGVAAGYLIYLLFFSKRVL